jgi:hypothetical protein
MPPSRAPVNSSSVWNQTQRARLALMPRYFFNISHGRAEQDEIGEELPHLQAARKEAIVTAGQILQCLDGSLQPGCDWQMEVTDESANPLYVIRISVKY